MRITYIVIESKKNSDIFNDDLLAVYKTTLKTRVSITATRTNYRRGAHTIRMVTKPNSEDQFMIYCFNEFFTRFLQRTLGPNTCSVPADTYVNNRHTNTITSQTSKGKRIVFHSLEAHVDSPLFRRPGGRNVTMDGLVIPFSVTVADWSPSRRLVGGVDQTPPANPPAWL